MDVDGGWYGVREVMPVLLELQRMIKRAQISSLWMGLCRLCGLAFFS